MDQAPITLRPGPASISEDEYRDLVRSTIPPAPPPVELSVVLDNCERLIHTRFEGRAQIKIVRTLCSLTALLQDLSGIPAGSIIVSKRALKPVLSVWVRHPPGSSGSCTHIARLADLANILDEILPTLQTLVTIPFRT